MPPAGAGRIQQLQTLANPVDFGCYALSVAGESGNWWQCAPRQATLPVPFVRGWPHPVSRARRVAAGGCVCKYGISMGYARGHVAARRCRAHAGLWDC